jgi:hypothetical protein
MGYIYYLENVRCVRNDNPIAPVLNAFTNVVGQPLSTLNTSNIVMVYGSFSGTVATSISGAGSPQYQICSDSACSTVVTAWTSGASTVSDSQFVQLRLTSSASYNTTNTATFTAGSGSGGWSVKTAIDCTASPSPGDICVDGTIYAGLTPDGNVKMFTTPCDYGMTGSQGSCTGISPGTQWGTNGVSTGYTSATTGKTNSANLITNYGAYNDGTVTGVPPAQNCASLNLYGHTDWYVPAYSELSVIYASAAAIGDFTTNWTSGIISSTEKSSTTSKNLNMVTGAEVDYGKDYGAEMRCVRH